MKKDEILLRRADYEFQDAQAKIGECNSLIKTALGFMGAIASFAFYTRVYDVLFLISSIAVVFGMIWLEDQVKIRRRMSIKKSILKDLLGKQYKKYKSNHSRSPLGSNGYLLSGWVVFVLFGAVPFLWYSLSFVISPFFKFDIFVDSVSFLGEKAVNVLLLNNWWFNLVFTMTTFLFVIYFTGVAYKASRRESAPQKH